MGVLPDSELARSEHNNIHITAQSLRTCHSRHIQAQCSKCVRQHRKLSSYWTARANAQLSCSMMHLPLHLPYICLGSCSNWLAGWLSRWLWKLSEADLAFELPFGQRKRQKSQIATARLLFVIFFLFTLPRWQVVTVDDSNSPDFCTSLPYCILGQSGP